MDLRSEAQLELLVVKSLRSLLWKQVASLRLEVEVVGGSARVGKGPQSLHLSAQEPRFPPPGRAPEGAGPHTHPCYKRLLSIHMRSINYVSSGIQTREAENNPAAQAPGGRLGSFPQGVGLSAWSKLSQGRYKKPAGRES